MPIIVSRDDGRFRDETDNVEQASEKAAHPIEADPLQGAVVEKARKKRRFELESCQQ